MTEQEQRGPAHRKSLHAFQVAAEAAKASKGVGAFLKAAAGTQAGQHRYLVAQADAIMRAATNGQQVSAQTSKLRELSDLQSVVAEPPEIKLLTTPHRTLVRHSRQQTELLQALVAPTTVVSETSATLAQLQQEAAERELAGQQLQDDVQRWTRVAGVSAILAVVAAVGIPYLQWVLG